MFAATAVCAVAKPITYVPTAEFRTTLVSVSRFALAKKSDSTLRKVVDRLKAALNHRDLAAIRTIIHPSRIYVDVNGRAGYLSYSQALVVLENFFSTETALSATFDFVSDNGVTGSAAGTLTARQAGRERQYHINAGFSKTSLGVWQLTRIVIQ